MIKKSVATKRKDDRINTETKGKDSQNKLINNQDNDDKNENESLSKTINNMNTDYSKIKSDDKKSNKSSNVKLKKVKNNNLKIKTMKKLEIKTLRQLKELESKLNHKFNKAIEFMSLINEDMDLQNIYFLHKFLNLDYLERLIELKDLLTIKSHIKYFNNYLL